MTKLKKKMFFGGGIASKFILYILLFSSAVTLVLTITQLYMDYRYGLDSIKKSIRQIEVSYLAGIINSLWVSDSDLLEIQLKGILKLSDMQYVDVVQDHETLVKMGEFHDAHVITKEFSLSYTYNNKTISLGRLRVVFTLKDLYHRLLNKTIVIVISQSLKTFMVSGFIFFIFYLLVARHLHMMANYAKTLDLNNLGRPFVLKRSQNNRKEDEFDLFAKAVNGMRMNLNDSYHQLQREIFERKQAEETLKIAQDYITNIIDSMPSTLIGVDADGRVTQWNKTVEQITGIASDVARGKSLFDVFPQMASEMEKITESIRTREIKQQLKRPRLLENSTCYEDVIIYPLIANGVEGVVIRVDDVTDKVRMEERMIQNEKMLSVGGLAAGMAHEINNPIAGVIQTACVMANRLNENINMPANIKAAEAAGTTMEAVRNFMEARGILRMITAIHDSGCRVAVIVDNMLSFARKSDAREYSHDLSELLDKTLGLAATDYDLKKNYDFRKIEIRKEYADGVPLVPCEGAKIQQVLLNILGNGAQAMQAAGVGKPTFILRTRFERERKMVCMEIEDNGPGMDEAIRKRVFEPFFTTKPAGEGTGLGLSVSYFIITENHGGEMAVESRPDSGAKYIIRLPLK